MKLTEMCRLCLIKSSVNSEELFFPIDNGFDEKFYKVTEIRLKPPNANNQDMFPSQVCITCVSELEQHYNYRNGLIEKQKRLNLLLGIKIEEPTVVPVITLCDSKPERVEPQQQEYVDMKPNLDEESVIDEILDPEVTEVDNEHETEQDEEPKESDSAENAAVETEEEAEYFETFEGYEQVEDESQVYVVNHESESEEVVDDEIDTTIDQVEEDYPDLESEEQYEFADTDEEYVVYEEDIITEEGDKNKRKYTRRSKEEIKQFKCWIKSCGSMFGFRASMRKHMLQSHSIICDKTTCFICGDRYDNTADFLAHVKGHTRKTECDVCKLTFINDESLIKHKKKFHSKKDDDARAFECHCGARFKRREHLQSHTVYKHSDKNARKFPCKECPSSFLTRQDLKNHEKSHAQFRIKCVYCEYDCRDLKSIKRHCLKLHHTTKIYQCLCLETYVTFRELQSHKKYCPIAHEAIPDESVIEY